MSATRKCYQCGDDDLAAIQQARQAQLRAHAAKLQADADKQFAKELKKAPEQANQASDWDVLDATLLGDEQQAVESADDTIGGMDALAATKEQPEAEANAAKVAASPKPETQAVDSTRDAEDNRKSANDDPVTEANVKALEAHEDAAKDAAEQKEEAAVNVDAKSAKSAKGKASSK